MKIKKICACIAAFMSITTTVSAADASVFVNGQKINEDAYIINDRIYVPLRAVSETLGASVTWDNNTRSAIVEQTEDDVVINANATFGSIDIYVPQYVRVIVKSTSIFGGVTDKTTPAADVNAPKVYVNSVCLFGGVDVK